MKKKVVWLVVTGWMVAALLLASCAPAVVEEKEKANFVKWTGTKLDGTVVEKMIEKPRYGGVHNIATNRGPSVWDDSVRGGHVSWATGIVNEVLRIVDFTRGPLGTDEFSGLLLSEPPYGLAVGLLAESWEMPDESTIIWHIRQGVHWQDKPPVDGREMTADDVVFTLRRGYSAVGYNRKNYPFLMDMENVENSIYISPTDEWAVVMKSLPGLSAPLFLIVTGNHSRIIAPEVFEKLGDDYFTDWKQVVGTGPYILENYVDGSSLTYLRNPNYWGHDPFFPENQLPYMDIVKLLIIPDLSTQMAGLRTGAIDTLSAISAEDAEGLMKTNPELKMISYIGNAPTIYTRVDKPELPFYDVRVRRALAMAINNQELVDLYYGGKATLFHWPIPPQTEFMDLYIPLEEMPESVKELYGYHPDKARQLLTEAGYPEGFTTEVVVASSPAEIVDMLAIIKEYWAEIGVDLKIDVKDPTVHASLQRSRNYDVFMSVVISDLFWFMREARLGIHANSSMVDEPLAYKLYEQIQRNYYDSEKRKTLMSDPLSEVLPGVPEAGGQPNWITYANEQAWFITLPAPDVYAVWQPWLKNYHGQWRGAFNGAGPGGGKSPPGGGQATRWAWLDQELKAAMGY